MVYTDGIHLIGDSVAQLHTFAKLMGLNRCWFDANPKHPHYDLGSKPNGFRKLMFIRAIDCGAKKLTAREIVAKFKS